MIKCNVTLCGKIFISAQEKTSKDGQKFLSFGVSIPMKGKDESVTELRINVSTQGTQAEAGNYISGRRVTVVGVMYVKKIENNVYYNLRATSPIQFNETTDPDNLSGPLSLPVRSVQKESRISKVRKVTISRSSMPSPMTRRARSRASIGYTSPISPLSMKISSRQENMLK